MTFEKPWYLAAGAVACLVMLFLWYRYDKRQAAALARFVAAARRVDLTRSVSTAKRRLQRGLTLIALALLFVALAGPLYGYRWEQVSRRGNEIVFAVDTSRSMDTPDMKPSRLTRAKLAIDDFADKLDGDAVGIVAFAGSAFLVCPITLDYGAFHESLNALDTATIPRGGTNIASAIHEAQLALRRRAGSDKILILVTDGEDLEGSALDAAQAAAHDDGLKIYTVGVGSASGDLIPVPADQGGGFVKDETGAYVKSRLDETALTAIAQATGGAYVPLGLRGEGLDALYTRVLGPLAKHDLASRQQKIYTQRYQWPLAGSLAALLSSLLIGNRRGGRVKRRAVAANPTVTNAGATATGTGAGTGRATGSGRATGTAHALGLAMLTAALPLIVLTARSAHADAAPATVPSTANTAAHVSAPAIAPLSTPVFDTQKPLVEFNAGTAAYKAGKFPDAARAFEQSISHSPSGDARRLADQEDAYYNLGNTLYRTGQTTEKSAPQDTIKKWTDALKAYDTALQLRADDADSKYNRDLVKRKLDELKQNQDQQNKNPDKNQGKDQNKGGGQGQGGQGQPPPGNPGNPGQPPPNSPPPDAKNDPQQGGQPPPGQPPPGQQPQQPQQQPPQQAQQPPPAQQQPPPAAQGSQPGQQKPPQQQPGSGNGQPPDQQADADARAAARAADNQHEPGQMSREEARELLDSVKGDEKHALGAPLAQRDPDDRNPDKPYKNW